jgi:hypothetical protein
MRSIIDTNRKCGCPFTANAETRENAEKNIFRFCALRLRVFRPHGSAGELGLRYIGVISMRGTRWLLLVAIAVIPGGDPQR